MKTKILTLLIILIFSGYSIAQDLNKPKGGGVLDIVTVIPGEGYSDMMFEGQISGYGSVYVAFKVASINSSKNSGTLDGQGRTIFRKWNSYIDASKGNLEKSGADVKFYFTDAINNGAMNFVMWDVNLIKEKSYCKVF